MCVSTVYWIIDVKHPLPLRDQDAVAVALFRIDELGMNCVCVCVCGAEASGRVLLKTNGEPGYEWQLLLLMKRCLATIRRRAWRVYVVFRLLSL